MLEVPASTEVPRGCRRRWEGVEAGLGPGTYAGTKLHSLHSLEQPLAELVFSDLCHLQVAFVPPPEVAQFQVYPLGLLQPYLGEREKLSLPHSSMAAAPKPVQAAVPKQHSLSAEQVRIELSGDQNSMGKKGQRIFMVQGKITF